MGTDVLSRKKINFIGRVMRYSYREWMGVIVAFPGCSHAVVASFKVIIRRFLEVSIMSQYNSGDNFLYFTTGGWNGNTKSDEDSSR